MTPKEIDLPIRKKTMQAPKDAIEKLSDTELARNVSCQIDDLLQNFCSNTSNPDQLDKILRNKLFAKLFRKLAKIWGDRKTGLYVFLLDIKHSIEKDHNSLSKIDRRCFIQIWNELTLLNNIILQWECNSLRAKINALLPKD